MNDIDRMYRAKLVAELRVDQARDDMIAADTKAKSTMHAEDIAAGIRAQREYHLALRDAEQAGAALYQAQYQEIRT